MVKAMAVRTKCLDGERITFGIGWTSICVVIVDMFATDVTTPLNPAAVKAAVRAETGRLSEMRRRWSPLMRNAWPNGSVGVVAVLGATTAI